MIYGPDDKPIPSMTDRDCDFDASDPYDQVAVIYTALMCQGCPAIYNGNASENKLLPYHVVGQGARHAGWLVEPFMGDWRVLCPACRVKEK